MGGAQTQPARCRGPGAEKYGWQKYGTRQAYKISQKIFPIIETWWRAVVRRPAKIAGWNARGRPNREYWPQCMERRYCALKIKAKEIQGGLQFLATLPLL